MAHAHSHAGHDHGHGPHDHGVSPDADRRYLTIALLLVGFMAAEVVVGILARSLALVTDEMPVVTIAPNDALLEKLKSNMQEVRARGGQLYVFADVDSRITSGDGLHVIRLPEHYGDLSPILHVAALQLLAYHTALARGTDVDKPRNLAKSVTVE